LKIYYDFTITHAAATEGIFFARGELLEKSPTINRNKLVEWLARRVPDLILTSKITKKHILESKEETKYGTRANQATFLNDDSSEEEDAKAESVCSTPKTKSKSKLRREHRLLEAQLTLDRQK
jgi:hypothetical protein